MITELKIDYLHESPKFMYKKLIQYTDAKTLHDVKGVPFQVWDTKSEETDWIECSEEEYKRYIEEVYTL